MIAEMVELQASHIGTELLELYKQLSHNESDPKPTIADMVKWYNRVKQRGDQVFLYVAIRPRYGDASSFETIIGGAGTLEKYFDPHIALIELSTV